MKHIKIAALLSIIFAIYVKTSFAHKQNFYQTNTDRIVLQTNSQYKKVLSGGKLDNFYIDLEENEFVSIEIMQNKADVAVNIYANDNNYIATIDSTNGDLGPEVVYILSNKFNTYRLEIEAIENAKSIGEYSIKVVEKRSANMSDKYLVKAQEAFPKAYKARYQNSDQGLVQAITFYKEALNNWIIGRQSQKEAETLYLLGFCHDQLDKYFEAKEYFTKALTLQQKLNDKQGKALTELGLGQVYLNLKDKKKGSEYLFLALNTCKEIDDKKLQIDILSILGEYYYFEGKFLESSKYFNEAIEFCNKIGDEEKRDQVKDNMKKLLVGK